MNAKVAQQELVSNMRKWQKIEDASVTSTSQVIKKTANPLIRIVMEIILRDSQMHYRVQEIVANSIDVKAISLTPDELAEVWKLIERHIDLEKKTLKMARKAIRAIKGQQKMVVQQYLLEYMLQDEEKHNKVLDNLEAVKRGMYPYA